MSASRDAQTSRTDPPARSGPPPARLMLLLVLIAVAIGVAAGYWVFVSLT